MRAMGMHGLETMRVIGMDYGRKVGSLREIKSRKLRAMNSIGLGGWAGRFVQRGLCDSFGS